MERSRKQVSAVATDGCQELIVFEIAQGSTRVVFAEQAELFHQLTQSNLRNQNRNFNEQP